MKKFSLLATLLLLLAFIVIAFRPQDNPINPYLPQPYWQVRSVDTMKYSRDLAREKNGDEDFLTVIDQQVHEISQLGSSHIVIATPYEEEFLPYMRAWVKTAREVGLHVWFRGNMAGWEKWFDYPGIGREEHTKQVVAFIRANPDLFQDGDIFTSCPECENGGPGDPRRTGDVEGHRRFLVGEYQAVTQAFQDIGKDVETRFYSMNYDVAWLVMDRETAKAMGGVVAIDHYVRNPQDLAVDAERLSKHSGSQVVISEFGAPIPDIHGSMSQEEQSTWLRTALTALSEKDSVIGVNYWVSVGGTTSLWSKDGTARDAAGVLSEFYSKKN